MAKTRKAPDFLQVAWDNLDMVVRWLLEVGQSPQDIEDAVKRRIEEATEPRT